VCQWLTPIILATWEAEIKKIMVLSQSRKIVPKALSQKYPMQKGAGKEAQGVEGLPSNCETLSSNPSATKKRKVIRIEFTVSHFRKGLRAR
jgi:hypothetical protein